MSLADILLLPVSSGPTEATWQRESESTCKHEYKLESTRRSSISLFLKLTHSNILHRRHAGIMPVEDDIHLKAVIESEYVIISTMRRANVKGGVSD